MHQDIVHTPIRFQGVGILSLYLSQGIAHVEALLGTTPLEGITGSLLSCSAEDLKLEMGLQGYLLQQDFKCLGKAMTQCCLTNIWEFMHTGKISINHPLQDLSV